MADVFGINERYYADDHWETWIGPRVNRHDENSLQVMREVQRVFQEANKVKECVDRHRRSLTAKPAAWSLLSNGNALDSPEIEGAIRMQLGWMLPRSGSERLLTHSELPSWQMPAKRHDQYRTWLNQSLIFPNAIAEAMHNRLLGGKGYLRLWKPEKRKNSPPYMRVSLHAPHPDTIEIEEDDDGSIAKIRYTYTGKGEGGKDEQKVECQWLGEDGLTYFHTETTGGKVEKDSEFFLDLGGRYTIARIRGVPIVNHSIRRLQDGINYILTLMVRNLQYGGFLRDIVTNGLPPGDFDDKGKFIPSEQGWQEGPGQKMMLTGLPIFDEDGNIKGYTNPAVDTKEPVDVEPFLKAVRATAALIYEQFGQGHVLASDYSISGVSRQQLRQDFVLAISEDVTALQVAQSEIYAAAHLLNVDDLASLPAGFDVQVQPRVAIADPTPEEVNSTLAIYNSSLMSKRTAMQQVGIENPEAEIQQINAERNERTKKPSVDLDKETSGGTDDPDDPLDKEPDDQPDDT